jgi:hypothetical protein
MKKYLIEKFCTSRKKIDALAKKLNILEAINNCSYSELKRTINLINK